MVYRELFKWGNSNNSKNIVFIILNFPRVILVIYNNNLKKYFNMHNSNIISIVIIYLFKTTSGIEIIINILKSFNTLGRNILDRFVI